MSMPERHNADRSSSPFQSAQHQGDGNYNHEDLLLSSSEQSPESQHDLRETRITEDASPEVTMNDGASSGSNGSLVRDAPKERDQVSSSPGEGNNDTDSNILPSRPNKYHGPPSTWRNWTAAERELAVSLQQLSASDLSVHLYNAFHLKIRSRRLLGQETQEHGEGSKVAEGWTPPKVWTAWPLPPEIVPREVCISSWEDKSVLFKQNYVQTHNSGHALKEILVSHVLKKAKERFWARDLEDDEPTTSDGKPGQGLGSELEQSRGNSEGIDMPCSENEIMESLDSPSIRSKEGDGTERGSQSANASQQVNNAPENVTSPTNSGVDQRFSNLVPEVMIDDDKAGEILEPILNHVLAKFDRLLMGLHNARSAYTGLSDSASESQKDVDELRQSSQGKRKRSRPRQTRGRPPSRDELAVGSDIGDTRDAKISSKSRTRSYRRSSSSGKQNRFRDHKTRFGLRDWSDVLGIASMTGWEVAVVEMSAIRCAALFEEGILFRTLTEGKDEATEISYLPRISKQPETKRFGGGFSGRCYDSSCGDENERLIGGVHVDGFLQPVKAENHWKRYKKLRQSVRPSRQSREE